MAWLFKRGPVYYIRYSLAGKAQGLDRQPELPDCERKTSAIRIRPGERRRLAASDQDADCERPGMAATCARNIDLLIHELGHHAGAMDCTREHANEMTRIAGTLAVLMLTRPALFDDYR